MSGKIFWMPCLVNKNPAAAIFPTGRVTHCRFPDRRKECWAIAQQRNVLEGAFTKDEGAEHLHSPEWTKEVFGERLKFFEEYKESPVKPVFDSRIGLLKKLICL